MGSKLAKPAALLLIDIQEGLNQQGYYGDIRSTPQLEENVTRLLEAFRAAPDCHVLHVCHHSTTPASPLYPTKPGVEFMKCAAPLPSEKVFSKSTNAAFIGNDLEKAIKELGIRCLVICGLITAHCVTTTVRFANNLRIVDHSFGDEPNDDESPGALVVVSDGTATFNVSFGGREFDAETVHAVHLGSIKDEFCDVLSTEQVISVLNS